MHPTRTTTTLLLGVACAVSAVSGCVQVSPAAVQPAAAPTAGAPPRHQPRGGPAAEPVVVRAPALEALEAVPERPARPAASGPAHDSPRRAAREAPGAPLEAAPPVPYIPEPPRHPGASSGRSEGRKGRSGQDAEVEREVLRRLPVRPADVCALGRRHGHWRPDSPEARICAGVQGG
ncbi:hypothetical protein ACFWUQ_16395 [Streptomyces sp. NPDC058662]|uniref:hypothetical protein n=1 Tax=Streptomyces sp. NPDC058662 TaxID=3346583 RepID=UPI0036489ACB